MKRIAVVLFNLGGPDSPDAVRPFLFNLFNDRAIIGLPQPFRWLLARFISSRRAPVAKAIYQEIGGSSPLLELTRGQANALQAALDQDGTVRVFIAMRYWHPMSDQTAAEVAAFAPDEVVLLPLYPQFSTTTTGSSIKDWRRAAARQGLKMPTVTVGCYPTAEGLVRAHVDLIESALAKMQTDQPIRLLFSAHGLPKRVIDAGDPYQWQVEQTAAAVSSAVTRDDLDWVVCYQSKVGRLEWIGPSTEDEIARAGREGVALLVTPIAFVSEHSETLVELDIEYREFAEKHGVSTYVRVPALGVHPAFVETLADLVRGVSGKRGCFSQDGAKLCPPGYSGCACAAATNA